MNKLDQYIVSNYPNDLRTWFIDEVRKPHHRVRINKVITNKGYLKKDHKILSRENMEYKGKEYITRKIILQTAKQILNFHSTYLLGHPVSLTGSESLVEAMNQVYRNGNFHDVDFRIVDKMNKYGDSYEYLYLDEQGVITSKVIDPADAYPVYNDRNEYIAFIEHYVIDSVSYYIVFKEDSVETWDNAGGILMVSSTRPNVTGLPIHYHSVSEDDEVFGESMLEDIIPLLDEMEDILSKFADSIYTYTLNPLPVISGQRIESSVPADAVGYILNLEDGATMDYKTTQLDYNSIKLLYDTLKSSLLEVAGMPSIAMGQANVSNVSEVSLKMLYSMADVKAMLNERYVRNGMIKRFKVIRGLLERQGNVFGDSDYVNVEFEYSRPVNVTDLLEQLETQYSMNAISVESIVEKSPLTNDKSVEMGRLKGQVTNGE